MSPLVTRFSRPAILATSALAVLFAPVTAHAGLVTITKNETLSIPGNVTGGRAGVFARADNNGAQVSDGPKFMSFTVVGPPNNSLNNFTATAVSGSYAGVGQTRVGPFTQNGNRLQATATLFASVSTPQTPPPNGGFAFGFAQVRIQGTITPQSITNSAGITVNDPTLIGQFKETANDGGAHVIDPISVELLDLQTGQDVLQEIYHNEFDSVAGGQVGFNGSGKLELSIDDLGPTIEAASFESSTDDPAATNLTGTASLENGVLDLTGIFANLADWTLTEDASGYIFDAVFNNSAIFNEIDVPLTGLLTNPSTAPTDTVDITVTTSLQVDEEAAPEPASLSLLGAGVLAALRLSRRTRLRTES